MAELSQAGPQDPASAAEPPLPAEAGPGPGSGEPIDWGAARWVARRVASRGEPRDRDHLIGLQQDLDEMVPLAVDLVAKETGWQPVGEPRAMIVDRSGWVDANMRSFRQLMRPMLDSFPAATGPAAWVGPRVAGAELGLVLGWMASRVLGQYDMLVADDVEAADGSPDLDAVYLVGPNMIRLENQTKFPRREFRLWVILHELTHRAQFTSLDWTRPYFLEQVKVLTSEVDADPERMLRALGRIAESIRQRQNPFADGMAALFATKTQRLAMAKLGGLMSLLEGHGDYVMDRAGEDRIPGAKEFGDRLKARRNSTGAMRIFQQLVGMEAKMRQYEDGERFIEAIERDAPGRALQMAFASRSTVPLADEISDPPAWLARVGLNPLPQ